MLLPNQPAIQYLLKDVLDGLPDQDGVFHFFLEAAGAQLASKTLCHAMWVMLPDSDTASPEAWHSSGRIKFLPAEAEAWQNIYVCA